MDRNEEYMIGLVRELINCQMKTLWVEFKVNNDKPDEIENRRALSNGAALEGKTHGYMLWGIKDQSCEIVGTDFSPRSTKSWK